jgi:hypothetical protein
MSDYVGACFRLRMLNLRTFYDVCVPDYVCMYALCMELSLVHGKCPHIGFWMSGHVMYFFCRGVELRGQQKLEETSVSGCHQACRAMRIGAATCACHATPLGAAVLDNMV